MTATETKMADLDLYHRILAKWPAGYKTQNLLEYTIAHICIKGPRIKKEKPKLILNNNLGQQVKCLELNKAWLEDASQTAYIVDEKGDIGVFQQPVPRTTDNLRFDHERTLSLIPYKLTECIIPPVTLQRLFTRGKRLLLNC